MQALTTGQSTEFGEIKFITQHRLETGDPRYAWVNSAVCVAEGRLLPGPAVEYNVCEVVASTAWQRRGIARELLAEPGVRGNRALAAATVYWASPWNQPTARFAPWNPDKAARGAGPPEQGCAPSGVRGRHATYAHAYGRSDRGFARPDEAPTNAQAQRSATSAARTSSSTRCSWTPVRCSSTAMGQGRMPRGLGLAAESRGSSAPAAQASATRWCGHGEGVGVVMGDRSGAGVVDGRVRRAHRGGRRGTVSSRWRPCSGGDPPRRHRRQELSGGAASRPGRRQRAGLR